VILNGFCYLNLEGEFTDFNLHPFGAIKKDVWPRFINASEPHIGILAIGWADDIVSPASILMVRNYMTRTGLSYGLHQYRFSYWSPNGGPVLLIESANLSNLFSCTGRDDLVLTTT
jgi:hypothetical protein